ncbi:MAG: hypothetical protein ACYS21_18120 [Planctomycetota bacterium]
MSNGKTLAVILAVGLLAAGLSSAQRLEGKPTLEDNWNDFLHYTLIGRFDMAEGFALAILESDPDPVELFALGQKNQQGYKLLSRAKENVHQPDLAKLSGELWTIIELGRFLRRSNAKVVFDEIKRLSTTERGRLTAVKRLENSGEYAIPLMLDALGDNSRKEEWPNIVWALPKIGRDAIRPLAAALQTDNTSVKAESVGEASLKSTRTPGTFPPPSCSTGWLKITITTPSLWRRPKMRNLPIYGSGIMTPGD